MKWLNTLIGIYHGWKDGRKKRGTGLKSSMNKLQVQEWALKVLRSSETPEQVETGLRLMELALATDTKEYRIWSNFRLALGLSND